MLNSFENNVYMHYDAITNFYKNNQKKENLRIESSSFYKLVKTFEEIEKREKERYFNHDLFLFLNNYSIDHEKNEIKLNIYEEFSESLNKIKINLAYFLIIEINEIIEIIEKELNNLFINLS